MIRQGATTNTYQNVFRLDAPRPLKLEFNLEVFGPEEGSVVGREVVVGGDEVSDDDEDDEDGDEDAGVLHRAHHLAPEGLDFRHPDVIL